jgi:hypothetical protein
VEMRVIIRLQCSLSVRQAVPGSGCDVVSDFTCNHSSRDPRPPGRASLGNQIGALLVQSANFRPLRAHRDTDGDCLDADLAA